MKRRVLSIVIVMAVLLLGIGMAVHAEDPTPTQPVVAGTLKAEGDGMIGLTGKGKVEIQGHSSGIIWVRQGTVETVGSGERFDIPNRGTLLVAWNGLVTVSGDRIGLRILGHRIDFTATGMGVANLVGTGKWEKGDGEKGDWSATGVKVRYGGLAVIQGKGTLTVKGAGEARIRGAGRVEIQGHGMGVIAIKGATKVEVSPQAQGKAKGQRTDQPDGTVILRNWEGTVVAEGTQMEIGMRSQQIDFKATGKGTVVLRGTGTYQIGEKQGNWVATGMRIDYTE